MRASRARSVDLHAGSVVGARVVFHSAPIAFGHIRNLLDTTFACTKVCETELQFRARMANVVGYVNGHDFAAKDGRGLLGICKALRPRCVELLYCSGGRLRY